MPYVTPTPASPITARAAFCIERAIECSSGIKKRPRTAAQWNVKLLQEYMSAKHLTPKRTQRAFRTIQNIKDQYDLE